MEGVLVKLVKLVFLSLDRLFLNHPYKSSGMGLTHHRQQQKNEHARIVERIPKEVTTGTIMMLNLKKETIYLRGKGLDCKGMSDLITL